MKKLRTKVVSILSGAEWPHRKAVAVMSMKRCLGTVNRPPSNLKMRFTQVVFDAQLVGGAPHNLH